MPLLPLYIWLRQDGPQKKRFILLVVVSAVVALVLAKVSSHFVPSPRPFIADHVIPYFAGTRDNGFPSDHTLLAGVIAFVTLVYNRKLGVVALVLAVLVGWARVVSGVHHAMDIAGSLAISALSVFLTAYVVRKLASRSSPASKLP